jgi:succinate-semialdehyde dehydrogenase/glutarate-semialdehyde dehydrogenase
MSTLTSVNPSTLEPLGEVPVASERDVTSAVAAARGAQRLWAGKSLIERAAILRRAAGVTAERAEDLATLLVRESGKTLFEAYAAEVMATAETFRWLARYGPRHLRPERLKHASLLFRTKRSWLHYEPMGVVGIISPWNYPLSIPATETGFALMAGNAVVLKPSEHTPLIADEIKKVLVAAGIDPALVQIVHGEGDVGSALVGAGIDRLLFTGSVRTGRRVAEAAGARGIPVTLELGGKDAMYVRADADLDRAVGGAMFGGFFNAGQTCASVERLYVHRDVADAFVEKLTDRAKALRVGDPLDPNTDVGPMIHAQQRSIVAAHVEEAEHSGARKLTGGAVEVGMPGAFYAPAVLVDVPDDARLMREETFGPALPVRIVSSDEEAVRLANDTEFGLTASVWTKDRVRAREIADRLEAGTVFVNDVLYSYASPDAPWGGVKSSGTGRTHSKHGLLELAQVKHVSIEPDFVPQLGYPYGKAHTDLIRSAIKVVYGRGLPRVFAALKAGVSFVRVARAGKRRR